MHVINHPCYDPISYLLLTHWDQLTHVHYYLSLDIIGSGNGLSPVQRQANTSTNDDLLSIGPSVKFLSKSKYFHWWNCIWKYRLPKWQPSCLSLSVLRWVYEGLISMVSCQGQFTTVKIYCLCWIENDLDGNSWLHTVTRDFASSFLHVHHYRYDLLFHVDKHINPTNIAFMINCLLWI